MWECPKRSFIPQQAQSTGECLTSALIVLLRPSSCLVALLSCGFLLPLLFGCNLVSSSSLSLPPFLPKITRQFASAISALAALTSERFFLSTRSAVASPSGLASSPAPVPVTPSAGTPAPGAAATPTAGPTAYDVVGTVTPLSSADEILAATPPPPPVTSAVGAGPALPPPPLPPPVALFEPVLPDIAAPPESHEGAGPLASPPAVTTTAISPRPPSQTVPASSAQVQPALASLPFFWRTVPPEVAAAAGGATSGSTTPPASPATPHSTAAAAAATAASPRPTGSSKVGAQAVSRGGRKGL